MNFVQKTLAGFCLASALAAPGYSQDVTGDTVLVTVNGVEITAGHVIALVDRLPPEYNRLEDAVLFEGILDQLIQQTLLMETADKDSKAIKIARENEERALMASAALNALEEKLVTEDMILAAYDADYASLPTDLQFKASHILVETEDEAKALVTTLQGGQDFAELAKEKSTGPSGPNGGDLGWFGKGQMVPEFENAVVDMKPGGISEPIQTQFGWHVIKLFETRDVPPPSLEEVRQSITDELRGKVIEEEVIRLEKAATVDRTEVPADLSFIRNLDLLAD